MKERFMRKETSVWITADERDYIEVAKEEIKKRREELERFIQAKPYFLVTMESYEIKESKGNNKSVPKTVERMVDASMKFGIGPMAAVAGTIAELAVEAMRDAGARHAIVDNGGDIALINDRDALVGVYAGKSPLSNKIALIIKPSAALLGICTSSGTVGHSISFGNADATTVIANSASLADASATALGNAVTDISSMEKAFGLVRHVEGIKGAFIIYKEVFARWGEIPEIVMIGKKDK